MNESDPKSLMTIEGIMSLGRLKHVKKEGGGGGGGRGVKIREYVVVIYPKQMLGYVG